MAETTSIQIICTTQLREEERTQHKYQFERIITSAIDNTLSSFGDSLPQAFYSRLEKDFNLKKEEIPQRINELAAAIEEIFGISGKLVEAKILQSVHAQVPDFVHFPKSKDLLFADYLKSLSAIL